MEQSIHSKEYDALYQHNQTNMLRDMQHLSHTEKTLSTKLRAHTQMTEPRYPTETIDASLVNIEAQSAHLNSKHFKPEDLPEDLRQYEQRILQQLEQDEQDEEDDEII